MPLDHKAIVKQIDDVLAKSHLHSSSQRSHSDFSDLPEQKLSEAVNLIYSALQKLAPVDSVYIHNAEPYKEYLTGSIGLP